MLNAVSEPIQAWVFVVDGDAATRDSIASLVESHGFGAEEFSAAEQFLTSYDDSRVGCVVAELRGRSGFELLEAMSREPCLPPVVMTTTQADVALAVRAMGMGAVTVLQKPCSESELWEAICRALALHHGRRRHEAHLRERRSLMESLTAVENTVLDLVLAGKTNKGIARELRVGLRTVEARRHSIMAKFGTRSLAEMVWVAWETRTLTAAPGLRRDDAHAFSSKPHDPAFSC